MPSVAHHDLIPTYMDESQCKGVQLLLHTSPPLGQQVPASRQDPLANFLSALFKLYIDLNFVYMEINPIVFVDGRVTPLDMAAKIDETASFLCGQKWGEIDFPAPFGELSSKISALFFNTAATVVTFPINAMKSVTNGLS